MLLKCRLYIRALIIKWKNNPFCIDCKLEKAIHLLSKINLKSINDRGGNSCSQVGFMSC